MSRFEQWYKEHVEGQGGVSVFGFAFLASGICPPLGLIIIPTLVAWGSGAFVVCHSLDAAEWFGKTAYNAALGAPSSDASIDAEVDNLGEDSSSGSD